jgi:ribA/ribD-fused uncharacterized protein
MQTLQFENTEQYMMWAKAVLFRDLSVACRLLSAEGADPRTAKSLGRQVSGFDAEVWARYARQIVEYGCVQKFGQSKRLRRLLVKTGGKVLVEAAPTDPVWGIGLNRQAAQFRAPVSWGGTNWLGQVLMRTRHRLEAGGDGSSGKDTSSAQVVGTTAATAEQPAVKGRKHSKKSTKGGKKKHRVQQDYIGSL